MVPNANANEKVTYGSADGNAAGGGGGGVGGGPISKRGAEGDGILPGNPLSPSPSRLLKEEGRRFAAATDDVADL